MRIVDDAPGTVHHFVIPAQQLRKALDKDRRAAAALRKQAARAREHIDAAEAETAAALRPLEAARRQHASDVLLFEEMHAAADAQLRAFVDELQLAANPPKAKRTKKKKKKKRAKKAVDPFAPAPGSARGKSAGAEHRVSK